MTIGGSGQARAYRLFVSYSHRNEAQRDRLLTALTPLQNIGLIAELWHDRAIDAGDDWLDTIEQAMARADGAIFLLCEGFCASAFCLDKEVPVFLQKHRDEGAVVIFVLGDYCGWDNYDFIKRFQVVPRDNKPVTSFRPYSKAYTRVQQEIRQTLIKHRDEISHRRAAMVTPLRRIAGASVRRLAKAVAGWLGGLADGAIATPFPVFTPPEIPSQPENTPTSELPRLLAKLPGFTAKLFGREDELQRMDAWRGHKGVWLWVAEGGYGKSALVRWWLERQTFEPGTRFLGQSFYSQGSHNQATTARPFLLAALAEWDIAHAIDAPDAELGRLLAQAAVLAPSLIVLDGLEPLQQAAPGDARLHGVLRDQGLAALLAGLAENPGKALCLATSRLLLPDAAISRSAYFRQETLPGLSPIDAQDLLAQRGVRGGAGVPPASGQDGRAPGESLSPSINTVRPEPVEACPEPVEGGVGVSTSSTRTESLNNGDGSIAQMAARCGYHPLALVLAAEFCHSFLDDSAAAFLARPWDLRTGSAHAATVMAWFDDALAQERQNLDRDLARVLGLFDRPAPWAALLALQQQDPPIPGLTEALHRADEDDLLEALARLKQWGLLDADLARPAPDLDAHPLVREHFGGELEQDNPEAFRAAHRLLFDWFRKLPEKDQPDTLEELEPLYRAMVHGCKAGAWRTARDKVYRDRIYRSNQGYTLFQLGAYSSDLAALAGFFPNGWAAPPVTGEGEEELSEANRSWLLGVVAFCLTSLGRLLDALEPRRIGRQMDKKAEDWSNFCASSEGLIDLLAPLGRWAEAGVVADEAVTAAPHIKNHTGRWQSTIFARAHRGRVLHGQGRLADAVAAFTKAEALQAVSGSQEPHLFSVRGFDYAQLLLERACRPEQWQKILKRGRSSLAIMARLEHLLSQSLDYCTIGLALSELDESTEASAALDRAVATMQRAGNINNLPIMHLARARHRRRLGDLAGAWADHDAALRIAEAGAMRTYLADAALLAGQLHLDASIRQKTGSVFQTESVSAQYARAAEIIHADGYGRRLAELHLLDARLRHYQHDPKAARAALQAAEARIRAIGQWGLWRELRQTAAELGLPVPVIEHNGMQDSSCQEKP